MTSRTAKPFAVSIALITALLPIAWVLHSSGHKQAALLVSAIAAGMSISGLIFVYPETVAKTIRRRWRR